MSFVWTEEEARYLKAVLQWQDTPTTQETHSPVTPSTPPPATVGEIRLLVVGAKGVGKSSVLTRLGQGSFHEDSSPSNLSHEHGCRRAIGIDAKSHMIDVLEIPSQQLDSRTLLNQALGMTEAAVILYDVRDAASFRRAVGLAEFARTETNGKRGYSVVLAGNKSDTDDEERGVSWAEGARTAATLQGAGMTVQFIEVSAKTGDNVERLFVDLGREVLALRQRARQRRELAERGPGDGDLTPSPGKRRIGFWRILASPFGKRSVSSGS